jgi:hypothetical protein
MHARGSALPPERTSARIVEARFDHEPLGIAGHAHYHARVRLAHDTRWRSAFTFLATDSLLDESELVGLTLDEARSRFVR